MLDSRELKIYNRVVEYVIHNNYTKTPILNELLEYIVSRDVKYLRKALKLILNQKKSTLVCENNNCRILDGRQNCLE